ncbi:hypothetical protein CGMCC3_g2972 [Colletotrichum fructicola]|nr:uncharacterized protein CGMCC3_g2972 [Colletotrichum fructicola]KAE9581015.1 hypothetical protein CGMCC3_g2972 [Colletotrichum fructicola]
MVTLPESNMCYAAKRCAFLPMHPNRPAAALTLPCFTLISHTEH